MCSDLNTLDSNFRSSGTLFNTFFENIGTYFELWFKEINKYPKIAKIILYNFLKSS